MKKIILTAACALAVSQLQAQETDFSFHVTFGTSLATTSGMSFAASDVVPFDAAASFYFDEGFWVSQKIGESNFATVRGFDFSVSYLGLGDQVVALGEDIGQPAGTYLVDGRSTLKSSNVGKISLEMPLGLSWYRNDTRALSAGLYGAWHLVAIGQETFTANDGGWMAVESIQGRLNTSRFAYGAFVDLRLKGATSLYVKSELTPFFRQREDLSTPMFTSNAIGLRVSIGD